jgi:hypothetical protein
VLRFALFHVLFSFSKGRKERRKERKRKDTERNREIEKER